MTGVLLQGGEFRHTESRMPCEDRQTESRDGPVKMEAESSFVQLQARGTPRISRNHQKLEENYGTDSSSESPRNQLC